MEPLHHQILLGHSAEDPAHGDLTVVVPQPSARSNQLHRKHLSDFDPLVEEVSDLDCLRDLDHRSDDDPLERIDLANADT